MSHPRQRSPRRATLVIAAVVALLLGLVAPAQAADDAVISGTITSIASPGKPSQPLGYTYVALYTKSGDYWEFAGDTSAEEDGTYSFTGLAPGDYRVRVGRGATYDPDTGAATDYAGLVYPDKPFVEQGTTIKAVSGTTKTVNVTLPLASHITGAIEGLSTDAIASGNIGVSAYRYNATTESWNYVESSYLADESGTFDVSGLLAGTYRLEYNDDGGDHLTEYYDNKSTIEAAQDITVTQGETKSGYDATLSKAGRVTGTVHTVTGAPLEGVYVMVQAHTGADGEWATIGDTSTDEAGAYSIGKLPSGTYRVRFEPQDESYAAEFYNGKDDEDDATPVVVTEGETTSGIDAVIAQYGSITGKVTLPNGAAAPDVSVDVYRASGDSWTFVTNEYTDETGKYTIGQVRGGQYKVAFSPTDSSVAGEVYSDKTTLAEGNWVTVTGGSTTSNINAQLPKPSTITGAVKTPSGVSDDNARTVRAVNTATGESREVVADTKLPGTGGWKYSLSGLSAGSYRVEFARASGQSLALGQYYKDKPETAGAGAATVVTVGTGQTKSSIDASLSSNGGTITGRLLNSQGQPVKCYVMAMTADDSRTTRTAFSSATTGDFAIRGLSTGSYQLVAVSGYPGGEACHVAPTEDNPYGYQDYFYDTSVESPGHSTPQKTEADPISVTEGSAATVGDFYYGPVTSPTFSSAPSPKVSGKGAVGSTLKTTAGTATPQQDSVRYQWYRGTTAIRGATGASYKLVAADAGSAVSVRVTYVKARYVNLGRASTNAVKVGAYNVKKPSIIGTAKVGKKLTASKGTWGGSSWSYGYQWYRGSTAIRGATMSTYTTTRSDRGKTLKVKVTASKRGYTSASATSAGRRIS